MNIKEVRKFYYDGFHFINDAETAIIDENKHQICFEHYYDGNIYLNMNLLDTVIRDEKNNRLMIYTFDASEKHEKQCFKKLVKYINLDLKERIKKIQKKIKENNDFIKGFK